MTAVYADGFDIERIVPLLNAVLSKERDDIIWDKVYDTITESDAPPFSSPRLIYPADAMAA